jgi:deferrochelatase/peroxidase EfeB
LFAGDRFGIGDRRPPALVPLPTFRGEALDPAAGNGDLCVQACASNPTAAHQAVRALLNSAREHVTLRWRQTGFCAEDGTPDPPGMFGFRDGTSNLDVDDPAETAEHLWVNDGPGWLHGGSYLVMRRIRLLLDTWDRTPLAEQEAVIGRRQAGNQRIAVGPTAHSRLAAPAANNGAKLLRRAYSYDAGVDPNGLMDAGLIFLCFQRDPSRQFVAIQRRLAGHDALNAFSQHRASGLFACPPGVQPGSWIGAELLS